VVLVLVDLVLVVLVLADLVLADLVLADLVLADLVLADLVLADLVLADLVLADLVQVVRAGLLEITSQSSRIARLRFARKSCFVRSKRQDPIRCLGSAVFSWSDDSSDSGGRFIFCHHAAGEDSMSRVE
jgi:hypothetical protein